MHCTESHLQLPGYPRVKQVYSCFLARHNFCQQQVLQAARLRDASGSMLPPDWQAALQRHADEREVGADALSQPPSATRRARTLKFLSMHTVLEQVSSGLWGLPLERDSSARRRNPSVRSCCWFANEQSGMTLLIVPVVRADPIVVADLVVASVAIALRLATPSLPPTALAVANNSSGSAPAGVVDWLPMM
mmetsp:Transcript_90892/g.252893  ORF Transcript_90892/g.252893 Transcript_90892/m.252893 type:complete len:191 (-) Transcript_90892:393-965(-)